MLVSKETRKNILDFLERLCETSNMSKKTLGYTMRSYHVSCPFILMIFLFYGPQWAVTIHAFNLICIFFLFTVIFNGCLLTMLEHRLCGDEYTIADPFIEQFGMELNSRNRMIISYFIAIGYFIFFFLVYFYRFYFRKGVNTIAKVANMASKAVTIPSAVSTVVSSVVSSAIPLPLIIPTTSL